MANTYLTNAELWNACRNADDSFKGVTAEATDAFFTARGFENLANNNPNILGDFYALSMKIHLQRVDFAGVKDLFAEQGFGEGYSGDIGSAIVQRIYQGIMYCIDPAWMNLQDGDSVDQDIVRKGKPEESFWAMNENIANMITIPDRFQYKNLFTSEFGMDTFTTGQSKSIVEGYKLQRAVDKEEAIHAAITSQAHPLQETQQYETADPTEASSIIAFVKLVRDIVGRLTYSKTGLGGKMNAGKFANKVEKSNLKLLIRPELENQLATISRLNAPEDLTLPIEKVMVESFGGIKPKLTASETYAAGTVRLTNDAVPSYDKYKAASDSTSVATIAANLTGATETPIYTGLGERIGTAYYLAGGIATTGTGKDVTTYTTIYIAKDEARYEDPHADLLAVIADKGVIFYNELNPVQVEPHRNARGRYTNLFLSSPDNGIAYDHRRTLVTINKKSN